ncbi:hypothetical protein [Wenxinia marina]|uniref:Uncharacterized protein n=1 Tax=Wenxinia marina DSM 24838 TaxID=1123501 RepID=A0A0D0Q6Q9_9RHOB|nr:hypothetical protein [Wenxinia marina]KIQ68122.1 hypothetical protein Wenmar_03337 [Wenxinia marina DSM 24838]GGL78456.1 hypothetical protein GCM10011392_36150 [Wenxinia marina]
MSDILRLSLPLTLWLASFSAVYGLQGLLCSSRWAPLADGGAGRLLLVVAAALAVAAQAALLLALRSPRWRANSAFVRSASLALAATALIATAWTLLPVAVVSYCW